MRLRIAHSSGQFTDTEKQQVADAKQLLMQIRKRNWAWVAGTEANAASVLGTALHRLSADANAVYHHGGTVWLVHPKGGAVSVGNPMGASSSSYDPLWYTWRPARDGAPQHPGT